jgi:hypothetical protein
MLKLGFILDLLFLLLFFLSFSLVLAPPLEIDREHA